MKDKTFFCALIPVLVLVGVQLLSVVALYINTIYLGNDFNHTLTIKIVTTYASLITWLALAISSIIYSVKNYKKSLGKVLGIICCFVVITVLLLAIYA